MHDEKRQQATIALAVFGPVDLAAALNSDLSSSKAAAVVRDAFESAYPKHDWKKKEGCYVFALRNQSVPIPYYVGQANRPLCTESASDKNLRHYSSVCARCKGTPVLFFVAAARPTKNDLDARLLDELEDELIRLTVRSNPKGALNVKGAIGKRKPYFIKGISELSYTSRVGRADAAARSFASMFFDSSSSDRSRAESKAR